MYCLQWLLPVLFIPKHLVHPSLLIDQALFLWLYIIGFVLERRSVRLLTGDGNLPAFAQIHPFQAVLRLYADLCRHRGLHLLQ